MILINFRSKIDCVKIWNLGSDWNSKIHYGNRSECVRLTEEELFLRSFGHRNSSSKNFWNFHFYFSLSVMFRVFDERSKILSFIYSEIQFGIFIKMRGTKLGQMCVLWQKVLRGRSVTIDLSRLLGFWIFQTPFPVASCFEHVLNMLQVFREKKINLISLYLKSQ